MAEHRLIQKYNDVLFAQLPDRLAIEVADGLADAYANYVREGLSADEAARATVAEFGDAQDVVEGFILSNPARRVARRLVATGPAVGVCWAVALIAEHAVDWPVPLLARVLVGATLIASVVVLVRAALGRGYRAVRRAGTAGCLGLAILDATAIALVLVAAPNFGWLVALAAMASATRLTCVARALRSVLA
jgi:hypothetical protein